MLQHNGSEHLHQRRAEQGWEPALCRYTFSIAKAKLLQLCTMQPSSMTESSFGDFDQTSVETCLDFSWGKGVSGVTRPQLRGLKESLGIGWILLPSCQIAFQQMILMDPNVKLRSHPIHLSACSTSQKNWRNSSHSKIDYHNANHFGKLQP